MSMRLSEFPVEPHPPTVNTVLPALLLLFDLTRQVVLGFTEVCSDARTVTCDTSSLVAGDGRLLDRSRRRCANPQHRGPARDRARHKSYARGAMSAAEIMRASSFCRAIVTSLAQTGGAIRKSSINVTS
jgi:hypothetical protein